MRSPFYGTTYLYGTPHGQREIGVMSGLGGTPIVGWITDSGSRRRVKTPHLPAGTPEHELQAKLDAWATLRGLPRIIPSRNHEGDHP